MKLELRENMYIRTNYGKIDKIFKITESYVKGVSQKDEFYAYDIDSIIKASYNIIDILEVGDYVNGCYVSNKRASVNEHLGGHPKEIGIIKCNAYFNQGNYNDCKFEWIEEQDIKSIVTHEQMEQMAYKVVE